MMVQSYSISLREYVPATSPPEKHQDFLTSQQPDLQLDQFSGCARPTHVHAGQSRYCVAKIFGVAKASDPSDAK